MEAAAAVRNVLARMHENGRNAGERVADNFGSAAPSRR